MQNNTFSTLFVGQNLIKLKDVDSTNNYLKELLSKSEPLAEGTVIMADNQYAGRGQQQNVWHAQPGKNIMLSLYLKPSFLPLNKQFYLNMAVSLAIHEAVFYFVGEGLTIKWPNDVYYKHQKMGGVLIENMLTGEKIKSSIIGIGLNINQTQFGEMLNDKATSTAKILQKELSLVDVAAKLFGFLEKYYLILKSEKFDNLQHEYQQLLYKFGQKSTFKQNGEIFEGLITGVKENGQLLVKTNTEKIKAFNFKEVEFIHTK